MSTRSLKQSGVTGSNFKKYNNTLVGNTAYNPSKATGGIVTTSGSYTYHTFNSSGTFIITAGPLSVEYLVIAGGGGGGSFASGGGAGGYRSSAPGVLSGRNSSAESPLTLSNGNYTVTIGGGGPKSTSDGVPGTSGGNSTFHTITSIGGGGGGSGNWTYYGNSGGSGGGSASSWTDTAAPGNGTSGQGFEGGGARVAFYESNGGGGGGAGSAGAYSDTVGTPGGSSLQWVDGVHRASGGAGTRRSVKGNRGLGIGPNTGGGGEGETQPSSPALASDSGVVILRYLI